MTRYYLGIDQGTTGTTALLVDQAFHVVGKKNVEHTQIYPRPGWVEHDPLEIWDAVHQAAAGVLLEHGVLPSQIRAIGLDNQGETCLVWDRHTGQPVYNAIVWQDRRTAAYADRLTQGYITLIREKTGLNPDAYFSATKLRWILDNVPGVREAASKGDILAGTLDSYLIWRLTGGEAFVTDPSTASRTMMFNLKTLDWDDDLLTLYDIPRGILPRVRSSSEVYGYTAEDAFFGNRIPVASCITDALAAMLAQACLSRGDIKTTYGTGCFMYANLGNTVSYSRNGLLTVAAWQAGDNITYAFDGGVYIAGAAVQWLRDKMKLIANSAQTEAIADSVTDTGDVYFVPAFSGLAAPHWDQYARGMIIGITGGTTGAHVVRATLESIAFQVYDNAMVMQKDMGEALTVMKVDGGPVVNNFLMQFQADILGVPVDVPEVTEMTAYGAAFLAALAVGDFGSLDDIRGCWRLARRYEPKMSADERQYRLSRWHKAVELSKGWAK